VVEGEELTVATNRSNIPGLPALPAGVSVLFKSALMTADAVGLTFGSPSGSQWGIFSEGEAVILADNVLSVTYRQDWAISTFPLEQGAFESYDKVAIPFDAHVRFSTGGSFADRQAFLDSIAAIAGDLKLYDVVTPEQVFLGCNIVHYDYKRTAQDVGLIVVDVWLTEVRATATQQFSSSQQSADESGAGNTRVADGFAAINNPQSPSAAPRVDGGTVQAQPVTAAQQSAVDRVLAQSMLP
jgi:hypothetical protein